MLYMLVRNKVADYGKWKQIFDSQAEANRAAGLTPAHLWRDAEDPNTVWFVLEVADIERAKQYLGAPESAEIGRAAGVIDGEVHFIENDE
jgi:hypothetical protein